MERQTSGWLIANALLWTGLGVGGTLLLQRLSPPPPTLAELADEAAQRLGALELTPAQTAQLAEIRTSWRDQLVTAETSFMDRLDSAAAAADARIQALLTDAQRTRYRELSLSESTNARVDH